jgi:rhodanese-related sulfurtransferase
VRKLRSWEHQRDYSHLSQRKIIDHCKELQMSANAFKFLALAGVTEFHTTTTTTTTTSTLTATTTTNNNNYYYNYCYYYLEVS